MGIAYDDNHLLAFVPGRHLQFHERRRLVASDCLSHCSDLKYNRTFIRIGVYDVMSASSLINRYKFEGIHHRRWSKIGYGPNLTRLLTLAFFDVVCRASCSPAPAPSPVFLLRAAVRQLSAAVEQVAIASASASRAIKRPTPTLRLATVTRKLVPFNTHYQVLQ